jgi:glycosyltransferase involved in cell wall biosynthesis
MKVALVHEFLNQYGGAERCLKVFHELFPEAPVYTFIYDKRKVDFCTEWNIKPSIIDKLPFARTHHYYYLWLYPTAVERFNLDEYDLVLSSSHAFGKAVRTKGIHVCYCHTPMRFVHVMQDDYLQDFSFMKRWVVRKILKRIGAWDIKTAKRVDYFVANSTEVQRRIKEIYGRESIVIFPPVDTDFYVPGDRDGDFYLIVSRLVAFKKIDLAVEAFNVMQKPLKIIGVGPELHGLKKIAHRNIEFLGNVTDSELRTLYQQCKALILPQFEDFGIVSIEAQACGRPVIAFKKGGARDTVIEGKTGHCFEQQTVQAIIRAVREFESMKFRKDICRENALRFERNVFKEHIRSYLTECLDQKGGQSHSS